MKDEMSVTELAKMECLRLAPSMHYVWLPFPSTFRWVEMNGMIQPMAYYSTLYKRRRKRACKEMDRKYWLLSSTTVYSDEELFAESISMHLLVILPGNGNYSICQFCMFPVRLLLHQGRPARIVIAVFVACEYPAWKYVRVAESGQLLVLVICATGANENHSLSKQ